MKRLYLKRRSSEATIFEEAFMCSICFLKRRSCEASMFEDAFF